MVYSPTGPTPSSKPGDDPLPWEEALEDGRLCNPFDDPERGSFEPLTPADILDRRPWAQQLKLAAWNNLCAPLAVTMAHLARCSATLPAPLIRLSFGLDERNTTGFNTYLLIVGRPGAGKDESHACAWRQGIIPVQEPPALLSAKQAKVQGVEEQTAWEPWTEGWWGLCDRHPVALSTGQGLVSSYLDADQITERLVQRRWCRWAFVDEAQLLTGNTAQEHTLLTVIRSMWGRGDAGQDNASAHLRRRISGVGLGVVICAQPTPDAAGSILSEWATTAHGTRERFLVADARDATRPRPPELEWYANYGRITFGPDIDPGTVMRAEDELVATAVDIRDRLGRGSELPPWYRLIDHGHHSMLLLVRLGALIALHDRPSGPHQVTMPDFELAGLLMRASKVARDGCEADIIAAVAEEGHERAVSDGKSRATRDLTREDRAEDRLETKLAELQDAFEQKVRRWIAAKSKDGETVNRRRVQLNGPKPTRRHMAMEPHGASKLRGFAVAALLERGEIALDDDGNLAVTPENGESR